MRISFILSLLVMSLNLLAQKNEIKYYSEVKEEVFHYNNDSFLILKVIQNEESEGFSNTHENDYLLQFKRDGFDTLIAFDEPYEPIEVATVKDLVNDYLAKRADEWFDEEMKEDYSISSAIRHIGEGVLSVSTYSYEYTGGAHGYGHGQTNSYDLVTKQFFTYEDVFKKGFEEYMYKRVKKDLEFEGTVGGLEESQADSLTEGNRSLGEHEYYFTEDYFVAYNQSYETMYGVFYGGYPGFQVDVPYKVLKRFIIKDSPIWRLYQKSKK